MSTSLNELWEHHIKSKGADFVHFIDVSALPADAIDDYSCVVLFGRALSKEYEICRVSAFLQIVQQSM